MSDSTLHPAQPDAAHPDIDLLADHAEELLTPEQSAELTTHLDSCAECRETYAALTELTTLLGDEPTPGPMPDDVMARIDAALTAEREHGATDTDAAEAADTDRADTDHAATPERARSLRRPGGDRPADNRPSGGRPRRSPRMRRVLTTLAIFLAAGGIGIAVSRGGDIDNTSGANSNIAGGVAPATAPSASPADGSSYDFTQANLAAEVQRLASDTQHAAGRNPAAAAGSATAAPSSPAALPSGSAGPGGPGRMSPNSTDTNPSAGSTPPFEASAQGQPAAPSCVLNAVPRPDAPAVQGVGRYLGVEVFALLYPDDNDPAHRWDVYLVQDSCTAPLVLLHQSVPRA